MKRHPTEETGAKLHQEKYHRGRKLRPGLHTKRHAPDVADLKKRLHELELENRRLRLLIIDLILEKDRLEEHPNRNLLKQAH
jgi:hypothetical protein